MKITDLIPKKAILVELKGRDKKSVIQELVQVAKKAHEGEKFSVPDIVEAIVAREKVGSTGLGGGVGIPHAKFADVKGVIGAFGRCDPGIDFAAVDGQPVQLVFLVLAPPSKNEQYLAALQKVMTALKRPNFAKFMRTAKGLKEIEDIFREVEEPAPV